MTVSLLIVLLVTTALTTTWCVLALRSGDEYKELIESIDAETFKYPELFCVGFKIMEIFHIDSKSKRARKRIKEIAEVQGKKYAEYYYYVLNGAKWTYGFTMLIIFSLLGCLGKSSVAFLFGLVLAFLLMWYLDEQMNDKLTERRDELLSDIPQMLSKLTLLVNSGMVMRDAWKRVAYGGERVLYKEMQATVREMQNGVSDLDAYRNFAERCGIKEIRRFSSTMIQNLQKGTSEVAYFLREMSDEIWEEKKHLVKRKGEAATSKLMAPMVLIFIGILGMIMVPVFMSM